MNGSNIAIGSTAAVNQTMNAPTVISRDQLFRDLGQTGLSQAQMDALAGALKSDGEVDGEPGPEVASWFEELRGKVATSVWTTTWGLVTAYLGLPAAS